MLEIKVENDQATRTGTHENVDKDQLLEPQKAAEHAKEDQPREDTQSSDSGSNINSGTATSETAKAPPQHAQRHRNDSKGASRTIWGPIALSPQVQEILQPCDCSDTEFVTWLDKNEKDETFIPSKDQVLSAKTVREGNTATIDMDLESHDHHKHPCEHHGAIGSVLHALHLDRDSREEERREDKQDEAERKEKVDMEQWEQSLLMSHRSEEPKISTCIL